MVLITSDAKASITGLTLAKKWLTARTSHSALNYVKAYAHSTLVLTMQQLMIEATSKQYAFFTTGSDNKCNLTWVVKQEMKQLTDEIRTFEMIQTCTVMVMDTQRRLQNKTLKMSDKVEAAHENELRLAVPSCHGRR